VEWDVQLTPIAAPAAADTEVEVNLVVTTLQGASAVLGAASSLLRDLRGRIVVHLAQAIPYPLPLDAPPVSLESIHRRMIALSARWPVPIRVEVYLCRDRAETIRKVLQPGSLVMMEGRKRWWPTREQALARKLERDGHRVVLIHARGGSR
jgi:hypothetical protein